MTDEPTETPEARRRRLARERQKKCRARAKAGRKVHSIEVDDDDLAIALAREGDLDPTKDDNDAEVRAALERAIARWSSRSRVTT